MAATEAFRISGSGEMGLVSGVRVVVHTQSMPTLSSSALTASVGKVKGLEMAKSMTSKPISLALGMTQRSFSLKLSAQIKLSTPNLKYIKYPPYD